MFNIVNTIGVWWKPFGRLAKFFLQVCQTSLLHIEDTYSKKSFFSVKLVQQFWSVFWRWTFGRLVNTSIFGVQWIIRAKLFFWETSFSKFLSDLSRALLGVWPGNLRQVCWSYIQLSHWNFFGGKIFRKTFSFSIFCGTRYQFL